MLSQNLNNKSQEAKNFFCPALPLTLQAIAENLKSTIPENAQRELIISGVSSLELAQSSDLVYMDNPRYINALRNTKASVCLVGSKFAQYVPERTLAWVINNPYGAFAKIASYFFPEALCPQAIGNHSGISPASHVHPTAVVHPTATIDIGVVIGAGASVGPRSIIGAHTVIGPNVSIGSDSAIASGVTIICACIGDRVIVHSGVRIGQDGFGFAHGDKIPMKVPQIGCVRIENDVEIGANTTIDRGSLRDTIIGEGTKIDNLVQIGHNVSVGRNCIIVAQVGISGSTILEDGVMIGGQAGLSGHLRIGQRAQLAGGSHTSKNIPPGARWGGTPARPLRQWVREDSVLRRLSETSSFVKRPEEAYTFKSEPRDD